VRFLPLLLLAAAVATPLSAQVTEFPQTIAPGKFFLRMDAISVGVNRETATPNTFTALGLASTLLAVGLTPDVDIQAGVQFFARETVQYRGTQTSRSGLGDMTFRTKWTFWRDEPNGQAAAVIPFVKVPSSTGGIGNNHVEGGVIVPWSMMLGTGTEADATAEWDLLRNDANAGYDSRWFTSGFLRQHIVAGLGIYGEATLAVSSAGFSTFVGTLGAGATYDVSKTFQLDYSLNRGLGSRATDWTNVLRLRWEF
jgi:hypothetical protein